MIPHEWESATALSSVGVTLFFKTKYNECGEPVLPSEFFYGHQFLNRFLKAN